VFRPLGAVPKPMLIGIVVVVLAAAAILVRLSSSNGASQAEEPAADPCFSPTTEEGCEAVQVDDRDWRYLLRPAGTPTSDTVIVDPGGPGISVLSGQFNLASIDELGQYNLLVIEEPWVTADVSSECQGAVSDYYLTLRAMAAPDAHASAVAAQCDLGSGTFGFEADQYRNVVSTIAGKEDIQIVGFVGHSFASVRRAYLEDAAEALKPDWTVVTRPFPLGAQTQELVDERVDTIESAGIQVHGDFPAELEAADRSVEVTAFDAYSAAVSSGYVADDQMEAVTQALASADDPDLVGNLSDQLWMRYGRTSLSYGMIAIWDELCANGLNLEEELGNVAPEQSIEYILQGLVRPCDSPGKQIEPEISGTLCVTGAESDSVTPLSLIRESFNGHHIEEQPTSSHHDRGGLQECLATVGAL
jgi:hypothetical protein